MLSWTQCLSGAGQQSACCTVEPQGWATAERPGMGTACQQSGMLIGAPTVRSSNALTHIPTPTHSRNTLPSKRPNA